MSRMHNFIDSLSERSVTFRLAMFLPLLVVAIIMGALGGCLATYDYTFGQKDWR